MPLGNGLAAVTFGGGGGVLAADQSARCEVALPMLADATQAALRPLVPPIAAIANPVDLTPQAFNQEEWFARFPRALDVIAADPAIHSVLLQFGPMAQRGMEVARAICDFRRRTAKAVLFAWPLAPRGVTEFLREQRAYVFTEHARAIKVLGRIARWQAVGSVVESASEALTFDWSAHLANAGAGTVMSEPDCHRLLEAAGLPVAAGRLVRSADEAAEAAAAVGTPVAMKGISAQVTHRASAGLVALDVDSESGARDAYRLLTERAARAGVALDGVYVQRMIGDGLEVLVSAFRDPVFGPMISCGAGGNLTELIDDVTLQRAPVSQAQAERMIDRLRIARVANRMRAPPDRRVLAAFVARLSQLAAGAPWRRFVLEINPVKWDGGEVTAVDGLLIVEEP